MNEKDQVEIFNDVLTKQAQISIENLCIFIKKNKNLIHIDLTNTGLNEKQIWFFGRALRRCKSLRVLHLCGNPGITDRVKEYLATRAHAKVVDKINTIDF